MSAPITRIGIYYGSNGGSTKLVAQQLASALLDQTGLHLTLADIARVPMTDLLGHDLLLLGCSTWNYGELQDDWDLNFTAFQELDLDGVRVGFFGCGDQYTYPDTFGDALGTLADAAQVSGAVLVGALPTSGYEFSDSKAVQRGQFVGLLLDEDTEPELTPGRLAQWIARLTDELALPVRLHMPQETGA